MSYINVEHLIALRRAKGWDQKQLAQAAGIDRSVISRVERGLQTDCRLSVLVAIATALEVRAEMLILQTTPQDQLAFAPEIALMLNRLEKYAAGIQRQAAHIINAFLDGIED